MAEGKKYHGMTLEELRAKFYINIDGSEAPGTINLINAKLSKLWQDVSYYLADTKSMLDDLKKKMKAYERQIELEEQKVKWKYIVENKTLPKQEKWSDEARTTAAFVETRTQDLSDNLATVGEAINDLEEEFAVWETIKKNLKFIADRVDNSSMNNAVDAKITRGEPTNIPPKSVYGNENDKGEGKPLEEEGELF